MSINGQQIINIGLPNESIGSDSLYTAFTKVEQNFDTLFSCASPYTNFVSVSGIGISSNAANATVSFTNTGVTSIIAGTNITINRSNGAVTISSTGGGNGGGGTVTSVGVSPVSTSRIVVTNSPVVSSGNIDIDLATTGVVPGTYNAPTITLDAYGRIISAANAISSGTVTSVGIFPGSGIGVASSPVTTSGNITVTNTGVLRLTAGLGIEVSAPNGIVQVSAINTGTVTNVGISSTTLNISGSPILSSGIISIELPSAITLSGNITAANANLGNLVKANFFQGDGGLLSNIQLSPFSYIANGTSNVRTFVNGNVTTSVAGNANILVVTGTGANIAGTLRSTGNANVGNIGATAGVFTANITTTGNIYANSGTVGATSLSGTLTTATQTNITSLGTLGNLTVSGKVTAGQLQGDGGNISNIQGANVTGAVAFATTANTVAGANVVGTVSSATAATNASALLQNTSTATTVYPTFTTSGANGNSQAVVNTGIRANLGNASITATTFVGALSGAATSATTAGTVTTAAQPNITSVGTLTSLAVTGNTTSGNFVGRLANGNSSVRITQNGSMDFYVQDAVSFVVGGTGVNSVGAVLAGSNVTAPQLISNVLTGTGNPPFVVSSTVQVANLNAATSGTVRTNAQPNITSVGTLTSLAVTGNITGGNLVTGGILTVSGTGVSSIAGNLNMNSKNINNVANPILSTDVATKAYVDNFTATDFILSPADLASVATLQAAIYDNAGKTIWFPSKNWSVETTSPIVTSTGGTITYDSSTAGFDATLTLSFSNKANVAAATTGNITLSGEQTIDNVTTSSSRVLVKNQTNTRQNGIYVSSSGAWTRATDADTWDELVGASVSVTGGTVNSNTTWASTTTSGGTLGTTPIVWVSRKDFTSANTFSPGFTATINDLVLVNDETNVEHNGVYVVTSSTVLTRDEFTWELDTLAAGTDIDVPARTTLAVGNYITLVVNNPVRGLFRLTGDGAQVIGKFRFFNKAQRVNPDWKNPDTFTSTGSSISGTTLTIGTLTAGKISDGMLLTGTGVAANTYVVSNQTGSGSGSTWIVSVSQTVASTSINGIGKEDEKYKEWAENWNETNPDYQIVGYETKPWKTAWNESPDLINTLYEPIGAVNPAGRMSAIYSWDADYILIDGPFIDNFHTGVNLQGRDLTATSPEDTPKLQTVGNVVRNITGDRFDFLLLFKKQREFNYDNIVSEWIGHRVDDKPPHVVYGSGELTRFEENWNVHGGTVMAKGYLASSIVKLKTCKGVTWDDIIGYSSHSAVQIGDDCVGVGGRVTMIDQTRETDPMGGSAPTAVDINESPNFIMQGPIFVRQRTGEDAMKVLTVDRSSGFKVINGIDIECGYYSGKSSGKILIKESGNIDLGQIDYLDKNNRNVIVAQLNDTDIDDGGNASNCVLRFGSVVGTQRLASCVVDSSYNKFYVDPSRVGSWYGKTKVEVATTGNITLSGVQTIDNVTLSVPTRVLVKNQTNPRQNGIYVSSSTGAWTRATDAYTWTDLIGASVQVMRGNVNSNTSWACTISPGGTLDTPTSKTAVAAATTGNITLSGEQTIDNVATSSSRVLVKDQSNSAQNGIYVSSSGAWTRATDADTWSELVGASVSVTSGTVNSNTAWACTASPGGTLGTTEVPWISLSVTWTSLNVAAATTGNITLSGEQTIDNVATSSSRVLVKNQSNSAQNGIYVSSSGAWTRATDADTWSELVGAVGVLVAGGTVNSNTTWACTSPVNGTLGTTDVNWTIMPQTWDQSDAIINKGFSTGNYLIDETGTSEQVVNITPSTFTSTGSSISGTTLTIGTLTGGTIRIGMLLTTGAAANTYIVSGSGSTWTVSVSQTVASTSINGSAPVDLTEKATATLTIQKIPEDEDENPGMPYMFSNNDTVTIGNTTYTWKTSFDITGGSANQILIPNDTVATQYSMKKSLGYLQTIFLAAAITGGEYKGAGIGVIYGNGTLVNSQVDALSTGAQLSIQSETTGPSNIALSVNMTGGYASWSSSTLTGGGDPDLAKLGRTYIVTTGVSEVPFTFPASAPSGTWVGIIKGDTGVGTVTASVIPTLRAKQDSVTMVYDSEWRRTDLSPAWLASLQTTSVGLVEKTGVGTASIRAIGVASSSDVPDRAAADTRYVQRVGDLSSQLSITEYAATPPSGDWTDIFKSAMDAGYRNIYADGREFKLSDLELADDVLLEFGPNHTITNADPSSTNYMLYMGSARNVQIINPFFDLPPMLVANTGKMANITCAVVGGAIANPVTVTEGGSGYSPSNGTFDYTLPAGDKGTGGVIRFTTVGGVITAGTVITGGSGYIAFSGGRMLVGRSQYSGYSIYAGDGGGDYCENILIRGARQRYGRGFLRVDGANNINIEDCLLEDGGSSYIGMTFEKATNFRAVRNSIYRGHGSSLINGCAIRVSGDEPSIIRTGLISHNIIEDIYIGNGIDSNLCNVRDVSILSNIITMRDPLSVYAYQLKQGLTSSLTNLDEKGAENYIWRDNQAILYHPGAGGWDLQNNIKGETFEPWLDQTNIIDFRGCNDTTSSYAVRGTGISGGLIAPTIVECHTGVRLTGGTPGYNQNLVIAPLIKRCRYGVWIDGVGRSISVRNANITASDIGVYCAETGTADFRIEETKVRIPGRRINSITINTAGTGYTNGTYDVYANGGGQGLVFEVTVTAGALTSASLTAGGFGYLGGASGSFKIVVNPPNNWTGGTGGIVICTVTAGTVSSIAISAAGSGYLAGGAGVFAPEFGYGFRGTVTISGGICTGSSVINGGIGFTSNPTLAIGNLTLPSGIGSGSGTLALTGAVATATGYATRLIDVQSAKISRNWLESINSCVRLETSDSPALSCKNAQITDNTLVSSLPHISIEDANNEYTALHNTRIGPTSADTITTIANGAVRATGDLISLAPEGNVADNLDTINGALGFGHMITIAGSATAPITVTESGNIRVQAGTTRLLTDQYSTLELLWNGTYWIETGYSDASTPVVTSCTFTTFPSAATYSGRTILVTDVGVGGGSVWVSDGSSWNPTGPIVLARSAVQSAGHTGTVTETTVQSVTIPAGLMGTNRSIRVQHTWSMTANANAKTFRARLSTATSPPNGTAFNSTASAATTVTTVLSGRISNRNSASAQVVDPGALAGNGGNSTGAVATGTLNSANVSYVVFSAELGNTADTVYLERYLVELLP